MTQSQFNIVFPPRGRVGFDGGLNTKYPRAEIPDNESPDCLNVVFAGTAIQSRGGVTKLNSNAIGSFSGDGLYVRHENSGGETMVAFAGGTAYTWSGTTFATIGSAQSVFTAGQRVGAAEYENHIFFGNGGVTPYKWNGVAWTRHGVPQATGTVSAASITTSTGALNGQYRYKVAFVNSASVYGDVGTATVTLSVTNGKIYLTGIPTAPQSHGVSARRIYRNFASGATSTYGLLTTIADNTTTTYVDNATDDTLGTTPPTDNGEPPKYNTIVAHQGRLFCNDTANPNYIWYSELYEPYTFASTNFQPVGDASFDLVRGLAVYDNAVAIATNAGMWLLHTPSSDPTEWRVIRTRSPFGCKSPYGMFLYNNKLMFPALQSGKIVGFAALSGGTIDPDATALETYAAGSQLQSDRIETEMFDAQEAYADKISAITYKNRAYITLTDGDGNTANNRVYVFDFTRENFSKKQEAGWLLHTGINVAQFTIYDGMLYGIDSEETGFVREIGTSSANDDDAAINAYYWTKEFSGNPGHENLQKDFRKVHILVEKSGAWYMDLGYRVDSDSGVGITKQVDLTPGGSIWGAFNWGESNWSAGYQQGEATIFLGAVTGKRIQFKFSNQNTAGQSFKVHGINFTYNIKGRR